MRVSRSYLSLAIASPVDRQSVDRRHDGAPRPEDGSALPRVDVPRQIPLHPGLVLRLVHRHPPDVSERGHEAHENSTVGNGSGAAEDPNRIPVPLIRSLIVALDPNLDGHPICLLLGTTADNGYSIGRDDAVQLAVTGHHKRLHASHLTSSNTV